MSKVPTAMVITHNLLKKQWRNRVLRASPCLWMVLFFANRCSLWNLVSSEL